MPISCHFRDCKALLVANLTRVSSAAASTRPYFLWHVVAVADRSTDSPADLVPNIDAVCRRRCPWRVDTTLTVRRPVDRGRG